MEIHYGLKKRKKSIYKWSGNLSFLESDEVYLPIPNWHGLSKNIVFEVIVSNPNGELDENPLNDQLTSVIPLPNIFPNEFTLQIKTNSLDRARENSFTVSDLDGTVLYSDDSFSDSTEYNITMKINNGDYQFLLKDYMEDGISVHWWNRNSAPEKIGINGEVRFLSLSGDTLHQFNPDFGQELLYNFHVGRIP